MKHRFPCLASTYTPFKPSSSTSVTASVVIPAAIIKHAMPRLHVQRTFVLLLIGIAQFLPPVSKPSPLVQLPVDVFLLIANELPLDSKYLLSQTCKSIRATLSMDWPAELQKLPRAERRQVLVRLAYNLREYLYCAICCKLHRADIADVPFNPKYTRPGCTEARQCRHVEKPKPVEGHSYILVDTHVQLALKYTRLGGNTHADYLADLMKPYVAKILSDKRQCFSPSPSWIDARCTETPKIIDGRFLYETVWELRHKHGHRLYLYDLFGWARSKLCMDYSVLTLVGQLLHPYSIPGRDIRDASGWVMPDALSRRLSCDRCPADFHCRFDNDRWVICSWRDFGTETSTHYPKDGRQDICWRMSGWRAEHVEHMGNPVAPFSPGAIEATYLGEGGTTWKSFS